MNRLILLVVTVVAAGLLVTEATMRPNAGERVTLAAVYLAMGVVTVVAYQVLRRRQGRRLSTALWTVALGSVGVAGLTVVVAAQSMFISDHDRNLVLIALALGVGLGTSLAVVTADSIRADLGRLRAATERVAAGDLTARAALDRTDEVGEVARAFDQMTASLAAIEEERRVLLASVGHDLRTPLASLQAVIEGLQDGVVAEQGPALEGMARDVARLGRLVEDLFLYARMEAGKLTVRPERVDLVELADEAVEAFTHLGRRRGVAVSARSEGPVAATVDPWALGRVIRNLVDNAIRHARTRVEVAVAVDEGRPSLCVRDDGPGFSEEMRRVAFDRFRTGDEARGSEQGGAGLGLAIAKGIVEAHGGEIAIDDGPGGRVVVRL